jgi:hypothetical protein
LSGNPNSDLKLDFEMPYEIIRVLENGKCLVNAVTELTKCPDCDEPIRYGGSWKVSVFQLFSDIQINILQLIQAEHGTRDAIEYYDIVVSELIATHPPKYQVEV